MTLELRFHVNNRLIGAVEILRLQPQGNPTAPDTICRYRATYWTIEANGDHSAIRVAELEHRYGDGAALLARRALTALQLDPDIPVDADTAAYAEAVGPCYICGAIDNHEGRTHSEATGQNITRADADLIRAHRPTGRPTKGEEDWLVRNTDWMPGDRAGEYLGPRIQLEMRRLHQALADGGYDTTRGADGSGRTYVSDHATGQLWRIDVALAAASELEAGQ